MQNEKKRLFTNYVEGARCLNRDDEKSQSKCTYEKRCKYCKELQERHGRNMIQLVLEDVLYKLQVNHKCLIHFTRDYNETISSLLCVREIFSAYVSKNKLDLSYEEFCRKARRRNDEDDAYIEHSRGRVVKWTDEYFVQSIHDAKMNRILSGFSSKLATSDNNSERASQIINLESSLPTNFNACSYESDVSTVICIDSDNEERESKKKSEIVCLDLEDSFYAKTVTNDNDDEEATVVYIGSDQDSEDVSLASLESIQIMDDDVIWNSSTQNILSVVGTEFLANTAVS